jgi:hypothetical protein
VIPNWKRVAASARVYPVGAIRQGFMDVLSSEVKSRYPDGQRLEELFTIFRESLLDINSDKAWWLRKVQDHNRIGRELVDYVRRLVEESKKRADAEAALGRNDEPYKCSPSEPRRWLRGLPIMHIPIQTAAFAGAPTPVLPIRQL